ncbi:MAG: carboxypeptidase regulatory-like domain-containing protein, partial [Gemmatimonadota bacterium]|nr:carboxypeptidase regulatory-like domain-containing protein [Gemmatimonadota bacterium]MDE2866351.1 carboxypeptidase regulatory-like domain-containing protein [Gemmatimonadota bacterium]
PHMKVSGRKAVRQVYNHLSTLLYRARRTSKPRILPAFALLGLPLLACDQQVEPSPEPCTITGQVSIERVGIAGVSVTLSTGHSTATNANGHFRFDNIEGGSITITIGGPLIPPDATFDRTPTTTTVTCVGAIVVNFAGSYIRTARILGTVTIDNMALPGVTVVLAGTFHSVATTGDDGAFAFTDLRAGSYTIEMLTSGFDTDEIRFPSTRSGFTLGVGEVKVVSFDGTYLRTAGIRGRVSAEGEGLDGVKVSVTGGEDNANLTMVTDSIGHYAFSRLRAGDYVVAISDYGKGDYGFEADSQNVTVALRETATVDFEGIPLRTSSITGLVSVDGMGLERVRVVLSGTVEDETRTAADGQYAFGGLPAGDYTVAISRFDEDAYTFSTTSKDVTLARNEAKIVSFQGSPVDR